MIRTIKMILFAFIMIVLIVLGVANRGFVGLNLLPEPLKEYSPVPTEVELPVYAVILASVVVGLLLGYIIEYLRESKHRRAATQREQEARRLKSQVAQLKAKTGEDQDDVLALLN